MNTDSVQVNSPNIKYTANEIISNYEYSTTSVKRIDNTMIVSSSTASACLNQVNWNGVFYSFNQGYTGDAFTANSYATQCS